MIVATIGIVIISAAGFWLFGGIVLRVGGVLVALAGAFGLVVTGDANGILVFALGIVLWLAGHWHFGLRHHEYKSPLARRVFKQLLPERLDPTRDWGVPTVPLNPTRGSGSADEGSEQELDRPAPRSD